MAAPRLRIATRSAPSAHADGRRRRAADSRARIVEAMLEMVHAGEISPAAAEVAARAEVGLRTVFRHFKDMESLYREMAAVTEGEIQAILNVPVAGRDWRERLHDIVGRRAAVFEKITPFKRAADVHRHHSAFLAASHARLVSTAREILRRELPAEITRDRDLFEAVDLLLSFEAWNRLRRDQGLSVRRASEVLRLALGRLLA